MDEPPTITEPLVMPAVPTEQLSQQGGVGDLQAIAEADAIAALAKDAAGRGDLTTANGWLSQLQAITNRPGLSSNALVNIQSILGGAEAQVSQGNAIYVAAAIAASAAIFAPATAFEQMIFDRYMSQSERDYFQSIDPNRKDYRVDMVDENGNVISERVDGGRVRNAITNIIEESLPDKDKAGLEAAKTPEEKAARPKSRKGQLDALADDVQLLRSRKDAEAREARDAGGITEKELETKLVDNATQFSKVEAKINKAKEAHAALEAEQQKAATVSAIPMMAPLAAVMVNVEEKKVAAAEQEMKKELTTARPLIVEKAETLREETHEEQKKVSVKDAEKTEKVVQTVDMHEQLRPTQLAAAMPAKQAGATPSL